jgi:hypothetical protein
MRFKGRPIKKPIIEQLIMTPRKAGTDVMILKIFSPKNSAQKLEFLTQNKAKLCKILIITLIFEKNDNFFAENCRKSQKIVIITSTRGHYKNLMSNSLPGTACKPFRLRGPPKSPRRQLLGHVLPRQVQVGVIQSGLESRPQ